MIFEEFLKSQGSNPSQNQGLISTCAAPGINYTVQCCGNEKFPFVELDGAKDSFYFAFYCSALRFISLLRLAS